MKEDMFGRLPAAREGAQAQSSATGRAEEASLTGRTVREVRRQRGWSQKSLAHWLGISESYLGQVELEKRLPSASLRQKMRAWIESPDPKQRPAAKKYFALDGHRISDEEVNRVVRALLETMP